jgi:hypothetical protein
MRIGDAVDFFRVEAIVPTDWCGCERDAGAGEAWLEWTMEPTANGTQLCNARFRPAVWGRA